MKILVTGSRKYSDYAKVKSVIIDALGENIDEAIIVHGGARGADALAGQVAFQRGIEVRVYPAKWDYYGKAAGPKRNQEMLDKEHTPENPIEMVLAFPLKGSIGTWDMVRRAEAAGIPVKVIE